MPELPEVETIVRALRGPLVGRTITGIRATWANSIRLPIPELERAITGCTISSLNRRGKYLVASLTGNQSLILHLKMSGDLFVHPASEAPPSHVRTTFMLDNGYELRFKDPRKFGRVYCTSDPTSILGSLGPEPLEDSFTIARFRECFAGRRGKIKPLLLDQTCIAGIGNIYADESCFKAQIHPERRVETLSESELKELRKAIRAVLTAGIQHHGASFDMVYRGGEFQNYFNVYGRTDEPCRRCKKKIQHLTVGGRSTHFCPGCQSNPR